MVDLSPGTARRAFRSAPVLVVDDDRQARRTLCEMLASLGYDTVEADDGVDAQVALACHRVSLILLDLQLPYMSGRDLLRRIAQERGTHRPAVVVLSGSSDTWDRVSCRGLGVSAFLRRPLTRARLERIFSRLGLKPGRRPVQRPALGNQESGSSIETLPKSSV